MQIKFTYADIPNVPKDVDSSDNVAGVLDCVLDGHNHT